MDASYLIYGANGYSGELIARAAKARGHTPILAGRSPGAVNALARELRLPGRVFALDRPAEVDAGLAGVQLVLHCAGPFRHTFRPMVEGCLRKGVHYLDLAGDPLVLEALAELDARARARAITLLPGVGFDVVPSDCLAVHLQGRLPSASSLVLAFDGVERRSRGSTIGAIERLGQPSLVRRAGDLTPVPMGASTRSVDFGRGPQPALGIAWGDVCTAYFSTGIPNIEVYMAAARGTRFALVLASKLGGWVASAPVQALLKWRARRGSPGPSADERARGRTFFWGEASNGEGRRVVARIEAPDAYSLTVLTALALTEKVLAGHAASGFQTPAKAFGPDLILELPGVVRRDERS